MQPDYVYTFIAVAWAIFWLYWLVSSLGAKSSRMMMSAGAFIRIAILVCILVIYRIGHVNVATGMVHDLALQIIGILVLLAGLAMAVWARLYIGHNWGMPMSKVEGRELVTTGPYRYVRHPIYTGILFGLLGTVLATNLFLFVVLAGVVIYFVYSARDEERTLTKEFPKAYPKYKDTTKMLIPFVL